MILYHPVNANVVSDSLSRKIASDLTCLMAQLRVQPVFV